LNAGRYSEAAAILRDGVDAARLLWTADPGGRLGSYLARLGVALAASGQLLDAESVLLEAHARFEATIGTDDPRSIQVAAQLAELYDALDRDQPGNGFATKADNWRALGGSP
jgi:hypothetical protein